MQKQLFPTSWRKKIHSPLLQSPNQSIMIEWCLATYIIGGDGGKYAAQLNALFWKKCEGCKGHNKWCILLTLGLVTFLLLCGS